MPPASRRRSAWPPLRPDPRARFACEQCLMRGLSARAHRCYQYLHAARGHGGGTGRRSHQRRRATRRDGVGLRRPGLRRRPVSPHQAGGGWLAPPAPRAHGRGCRLATAVKARQILQRRGRGGPDPAGRARSRPDGPREARSRGPADRLLRDPAHRRRILERRSALFRRAAGDLRPVGIDPREIHGLLRPRTAFLHCGTTTRWIARCPRPATCW